MKQILLMIAVVAVVGCSNDTRKAAPDPVLPANEKLIADPIVERAIREELEKPKGKLTETDLAQVTALYLDRTQITDAGLKDVAKLQKLVYLSSNFTKITDAGLKDVAKLQKLEYVYLQGPEVTQAGVAELKKALPNCRILASNPPRETP